MKNLMMRNLNGMGSVMLTVVPVLSLMMLLTFGASSASADSVVYDLTLTNIALGTGPFVEVTVNRTSTTTADFTFASLTNGGNIYLMGDGSSAGANINASSFSVSSLSNTNTVAGFTAGTLTQINPPGTSNVSTWGSFNLVLDTSDGFPSSNTQIKFTVTDLSGTWLSASNVLTPNNDSQILVSHVFPCVLPCSNTETVTNTGFASGAVQQEQLPVPEPASLLLLGSGLAGLGFWGRKRRREIQA